MVMNFTAENTINGSFGELRYRGDIIGNVMSVEARAIIDRRDLRLAGTRLTQYKAMSVRGEGTFTIYKVTSQFTREIGSVFSNARPTGLMGNRELGTGGEGHVIDLLLKRS